MTASLAGFSAVPGILTASPRKPPRISANDLDTRGSVAPDDEAYWGQVQRAFNLDRSVVHLNSGGVCPIPASVQRAERAFQSAAYRGPFYAHQSVVKPQIEAVRRQLAREIGCSAEELALTRNTSEGMEICQLGIDLAPGDEVVTTEHDYPRMLNTWEQRVDREGVVLKKVPVPVPLDRPGVLINRLDDAISDRTRLIMCCHMVDLTGQILPAEEIVGLGTRRNVPVLVDGAQTFGQVPFGVDQLGCDFFATSLHKWLMGPHGTGLLFVRRDRIADVWPMMPAASSEREDIRKFEDVGTRSPAKLLALAEALAFRNAIGPDNMTGRLRYLRDYWLDQVLAVNGVRLRTETAAAGALATIDVDGRDPVALRDRLWHEYRVRVRPIKQSGVSGIRVSAGLHNTIDELDRFVLALRRVIKQPTATKHD